MQYKNFNQNGFSIVEVLIVILAVGLVGTVAITSFTDIRHRNHNSERQQDIKTVQRAIEDFYSQKEKYPSLAEINSASWRTKNLKTLLDSDLTDPSNSTAQFADTPTAKQYSYQPTAEDGAACDNITRDCMRYVLTATQEEADPYTKNNFN